MYIKSKIQISKMCRIRHMCIPSRLLCIPKDGTKFSGKLSVRVPGRGKKDSISNFLTFRHGRISIATLTSRQTAIVCRLPYLFHNFQQAKELLPRVSHTPRQHELFRGGWQHCVSSAVQGFENFGLYGVFPISVAVLVSFGNML